MIFRSQDSPFTESLMSSVIVVDVREHVCLQFINRAMLQKLRGNWPSPMFGCWGAFPSLKIMSCSENIPADASPVKWTLMFGQYEFFHIFPKVGCFEACIEFICGCRLVLATQTRTWLSALASQCSHSATEICCWKEGWRRRRWQNVLAVYSVVKDGRRLDRVYVSIVIMCTTANAIANHY